MRVFMRRKKTFAQDAPAPGAKELELIAKRKLLAASGAEHLKNRGVTEHLSERFFEAFGAPPVLTGEASGRTEQTGAKEPGGGAAGNGRTSGFGAITDAGGFFAPGSAGGGARKNAGLGNGVDEKNERKGASDAKSDFEQDSEFIRRFRQVAFARGHLIGAVIRGESSARIMLMSCLKRTAGQSGPKNFRQRKLFQSGASAQRNLEGGDRGKVIFNRGETDSAIALAVKSLRNARDTVDTLASFARGDSELPEESGAGTLRKIYPFLNDKAERSDIDDYKARIRESETGRGGAENRPVLRRAQFKTRAVVEYKARLKHRFLRELAEFSEKAEKAEAIFDGEELRREVASLTMPESPENKVNATEYASQTPPDESGADESAAPEPPEAPETNGKQAESESGL